MFTWLEAALNGPWGRRKQPRIPISAGEIVEAALACAAEGAAIVHLHAYDEASGRQRDAFELYAPVIERIRARSDVICYPTIPLAGGRDAAEPMAPPARYAAVQRLLEAGLIEWSVVDPGTVNFAEFADIAQGREGFVYANSEAEIRHGLELARRHRMTPSFAIYEPGFLRLGAALHAACPGAPQPVYRFMFSTGFTFGFPPEPWALDAYLFLLDGIAPASPWMVAGLGVELDGLIEHAVRRGGHVRVGLEDAPFGCAEDNPALVRRAAQRVAAAGSSPASAADVRAALRQCGATAAGRPPGAAAATSPST